MAYTIKVDISQLKTDIENVNNSIISTRTSLESLETALSQLDSMWEGPSSEAFKLAFQDDIEALTTILTNLTRMYNYEDYAKTEYEKCETMVSSYI